MRKQRIVAALTTKPFVYIATITFILYLTINAWVNEWHTFLPGLYNLFWYISLPYTILGIIIAVMVAVAVSLSYMRIKELQASSGATGLTFVGVFLGVMTGACPGCLVGILPAIAGIFGGALLLSDLPFYGVEIQLVTIAIMSFAIYTLAKDNTCKISSTKQS